MILKEEKDEEQCQKESAEGKQEKVARDAKQIEEDKFKIIYFNNLKINISLLKYVSKKIISTSLF
jgi:hypothetical protein